MSDSFIADIARPDRLGRKLKLVDQLRAQLLGGAHISPNLAQRGSVRSGGYYSARIAAIDPTKQGLIEF